MVHADIMVVQEEALHCFLLVQPNILGCVARHCVH